MRRTHVVVLVVLSGACSATAETVDTTSPATHVTTSVTAPAMTSTTVAPGDFTRTGDGGLLYLVESAPWFGGFELHMKSAGIEFGFRSPTGGEQLPQEILLRDLLWTFGNQHAEFIDPDGQVNVERYTRYLEENNWTDPEVYVPENVAEGRTPSNHPEVGKSQPFRLDFRLPFLISNAQSSTLEGFQSDNPNYYPGSGSDGCCVREFGITNDGQLFYGMYLVRSGIDPLPMDPVNFFPIVLDLGGTLTVTSRIVYPESDPAGQWALPNLYFGNPAYKTPLELALPYPVLNVFDYVTINAERTQLTVVMFAPIL